MYMQKRISSIFLIIIILLTVVLLPGCAKQDNTTVDINDLRDSMLEAFGDTTEMTTVDSSFENAEELFSYACDIDYSLVESYFLSYSTLGKADEIAVVQLKDEASVKLAEKGFEDHLDSRKKLFRQYAPDELKRTDNAKIFTNGNYAVLIISDKADEIKKVFDQKTGN